MLHREHGAMDLVVSSTPRVMRLTMGSDTPAICTLGLFRRRLRFTPLSSGDAQDMYVLALVTQKGAPSYGHVDVLLGKPRPGPWSSQTET